jgi:hypothetical protein
MNSATGVIFLGAAAVNATEHLLFPWFLEASHFDRGFCGLSGLPGFS